ncbi:MAG: YdcF family protein [Defluviitaleaceae bacterium]|nr:YdcF family protein [Defluviitaleaceae bacterium]
MNAHKRIKLLKRVSVCFVLVLLYIGVTAGRIWHYGSRDERQSADAAIILGAAAWHNHPSPVFLERIRHGIWLYEQGYVDYLIFTGGYGTGAEYSEAYVARRYALEAGIPFEFILIEEYSRTTEAHFSYVMSLIEAYEIETVILVSDPLHMLRAVRMASDAGLKAYSSPTPTSRYQTLQTQLPFLRQEVMYYIAYQIVSLFR